MTTTTLANGLTLVTRRNTSIPLVTADIWVRCGAANEPPHLSGLSHFLEHMVFKGTERIGPGEYDRRIENYGGYLNAATSHDYTHYYITVPARHFREAFRDLADVVARPSIDPAEYERERQVILEEIRRKQDSPFGYLYEWVFEETFPAGAYRRPILGYPDTVGAMPRDAMFAYHRTRYAPDSIAVVVAGDISESEARDTIEQALGDIPTAGKSGAEQLAVTHGIHSNNEPHPEPPQIRWGLDLTCKRPIKESYLMMAFPAPDLAGGENAEGFAADFVAQALGGGDASRLWRSIRETKQLVSSIALSYYALKSNSLFVVSATVEPANLETAKAAIHEEIAAFLREGVREDEIARTRKSIVNGYLFGTETNSGQASMLGYFLMLTGKHDFEETYLERVRKVGAADINAVARKFLRRETCNAFALIPGEEPAAAK